MSEPKPDATFANCPKCGEHLWLHHLPWAKEKDAALASLRAHVETLRRERDETVNQRAIESKELRAKITRQKSALYRIHLAAVEHRRVRRLESARAEAAESRVSALEAVFRPFAEYGARKAEGLPDAEILWQLITVDGSFAITVGDCRRAGAAIQAKEKP